MSLSNTLTLLLELGSVLSTLVLSATVGIIFRPSRLPYKQHVVFSTIRAIRRSTVLGRRPPAHDTASIYESFILKQGLPSRTTPLNSGTACLLWLGPREAQNVMLYLHGGAYTRPAAFGHIAVMHRLIEAAEQAGKSLQIAVLQYDLAPTQQYPQQLVQATEGLQYILKDLSVPSGKAFIAGDSAGGNLALGLLSHLAHPHPSLSPISLDASHPRLGGVFLLSPWVSFTNESPTWRQSQDTDFLVYEDLNHASTAFLGSSTTDHYNQPLHAPVEWWKHAVVGNIGITYGKNEVFAADIVSFGDRIKAVNDHVEVAGFECESHVQAVVNATIGWSATESERFFIDWILRLL